MQCCLFTQKAKHNSGINKSVYFAANFHAHDRIVTDLPSFLDLVCRFPGLPQKKQLSYSAKQLIAREVRASVSVILSY